jgi:superfamily I DNA/RNA helicase
MKTGNVKCPQCKKWCSIEPETIRDAKLKRLIFLLTEQGEHGLLRRWNRPYGQRQRGIVYCRTIPETENVAHFLQEQIPELRVGFYHGDLAKELRQQVYQHFISDDMNGLDIVVATNAFGMGIDVRRLGFVIHFDIPATPEAYYQEAGRAGRDAEFRSGKDCAQCILLYHEQDLEGQRRLMQQSTIEELHIRAVFEVLCRIKDRRGADFLVTEEEIRLMAGFEENGPPIPSILYYLENHATINGLRILERGESAAHLQQLAYEIEYQRRMADAVLSPLSRQLIEVFQNQLSLQERVLTMVDLHELADCLNWEIDQLRAEIRNLTSKHIIVPESHLYIRWARRKQEALQVIKTVCQDIVNMLQAENNLRRLKKGEEVLVDLHGLYKTGSLSALPSETFARFLAELARESTGDLQLFEYFELATRHGRPGHYKLRLKSSHEVQQILKEIYMQLRKTINRFAHEQEIIDEQKADAWDCIDLLQETQDYEDRQCLLYLIHLVETLGLLETKGDEEKSRQMAMHVSFKQQCRASDHIDTELFLLRNVQRAKVRKLELMQSYATAPQEQRASLFRDYFFGEIPLTQPFVMRADLTEKQRAVIRCTAGRHLVTGPAGSGKTPVLREHIRYLVEGMLVPPARILVVTHFQSANQRIGKDFENVRQGNKSLHLSTLNALGESIFKPNRHFLLRADGQPYYSENQELTLLTSDSTQHLIYQALLLAHEQQETPPDLWPENMEMPFFTEQFDPDPASVKLCFRAISLLRQHGIFPACLPTRAEIYDVLKSKKLQSYSPSFYYAVYLHYLSLMGKNGWYTYDDQIVFALALLRMYPHLAREIQNNYEHIIIDEFQDLTPAQFALVDLVSDAYGNIFAVGDEEQDIRVKEVRNLSFDSLSQNHPFEKHHLNINFRSVQEILDLAHSVRHPNNMVLSPQEAARGSRGELPTLIRVCAPSSPLDGKNGISNHLLQAMVDAALYQAERLPEVDAGSIALIVARANLLERVQSYIQQLQYPFSVLKNTYKYQSFHVKHVLTYFRLILDSHQDEEMEILLRHCLVPGFTWQQVKELKKIMRQNGQSLLEVVQDDNLLSQIGVTDQQISSLQQHMNIFLRRFSPDTAFFHLWEAISKLEDGPFTASTFQEQDAELEAVLRDVGQKTVRAAIDHIDSHISFVEEGRLYNKLILTSIDHAKSQDFDTVFLLGAHLLDKIWKDRKRLYVSISRARQRFFFLVDGNQQISENELLGSIPEQYYTLL